VKRTHAIGVLLAALFLSACGSQEPVPGAVPNQAAAPDRSAATLKKALLAVEDLPSGYAVQPEAEEGGATPVARSEDPKCQEFVRLINAETLPGSKASALVAFAGGNEGPFVEQWLEAMGEPSAVAGVQKQIETSVEECGEVTVSLPGAGAAEMELTSVEPPAIGSHPIAYRMSAKGGALGGFEITFVHTGVGDTLLTMDFVAIEPAAIEGLLSSAHAKATRTLKTSAG
jgi:hypothetical protein